MKCSASESIYQTRNKKIEFEQVFEQIKEIHLSNIYSSNEEELGEDEEVGWGEIDNNIDPKDLVIMKQTVSGNPIPPKWFSGSSLLSSQSVHIGSKLYVKFREILDY